MTDTPDEGATGVAEVIPEGATGATEQPEGASGATGAIEGASGATGAPETPAEAPKAPATDDPEADPLAASDEPAEEEFAEEAPKSKLPHPALRGVAGGPHSSNNGEHVAHGHKLPHTA